MTNKMLEQNTYLEKRISDILNDIAMGKLSLKSLTVILIQSLCVDLVRSRKISLEVHGSCLGDLASLFLCLIWVQ